MLQERTNTASATWPPRRPVGATFDAHSSAQGLRSAQLDRGESSHFTHRRSWRPVPSRAHAPELVCTESPRHCRQLKPVDTGSTCSSAGFTGSTCRGPTLTQRSPDRPLSWCGPWGNLLQHKHAGRSPRDVAAEAAGPRPPTRPALALTRLRMIDHGRRIRGERPGLFEPQVGLVIALKQLWSDHELPGCSGRDMAPGGERPRGNAVPSGGAPVEQRLADWRREALADRSKRPKSSPWRVPAEVEALVCELCRHPTRARRGTTRVATVREWNSARSPTATVRETGEQARPSMGATC